MINDRFRDNEGMCRVGKKVAQSISSPVGLKEAALDSPTFRATTLHFSDQVDFIESRKESCSLHSPERSARTRALLQLWHIRQAISL
jgi:hypothetical protein